MAKPKPFRYGVLLRVRARQEELRATALAEVRRQIRANELQQAEIVASQRRALAEASHVIHEEFDAAEVRRFYLYERHLAHLAVEKDAEVTRLRRLEQERRGELEDAMKQRRIVEKLKERLQGAFETAIAKEHQKAADEIATGRAALTRRVARAARRQAEGGAPCDS